MSTELKLLELSLLCAHWLLEQALRGVGGAAVAPRERLHHADGGGRDCWLLLGFRVPKFRGFWGVVSV